MTVICLPTEEKADIVHAFVNKTHTINELTDAYLRSRRTIIRVLEEAGVDPGIRRRPAYEADVQKELELKLVKPVLIRTKTPWYRKVWDYGMGLCT